MTKKAILAGSISAAVLGVSGFSIASQVWQAPDSYNSEPGFRILADAYMNKRSGMVAEVQGKVTRLIMDDTQVAREQKFVIQAINGQALLVTHDLSRSKKVPLAVGDTIRVRGEYRWSEPGGSLVWTTRGDGPDPRHGWIEHEGDRYD